MVKYIIHIADVHIMNYKRLDECQVKLQWFIQECKNFLLDKNKDEVRIVIAGDLVHNKTELSPECYTMAAWFLRQLDKICKTIVIAGNHDINTFNLERLDPLSAIWSMSKFKQVIYLDKQLEYVSDCFVDDNITWCLYSIFDKFAKPYIKEYKIKYPNNVNIGLFHGEIKSASTDTSFTSVNGFNASYFEDADFVLMGHLHKRQCIKFEGIPLVYSGSLIQKDFGENLSKHGYLIWNVEEQTYKEYDYNDKEYGFYTFKIKEESDIEQNVEEIINL